MPYSIYLEPKGVYTKYTGLVTSQEFFLAVSQVNAHPDFESFRYVIDDFLGCAEFQLTASDLEDAVAAAIGANMTNPRLVAALLATKVEIVSALLSISASLENNMCIRVFSNIEDARHWTNAPKS